MSKSNNLDGLTPEERGETPEERAYVDALNDAFTSGLHGRDAIEHARQICEAAQVSIATTVEAMPR